MKKTVVGVGVVLAFLAAFALAATGCKPGAGGGGGPEAKPIKIGAVIAVTGPAAPLGEPEKATLELMEADINKQGGINGRQIDVIIEDSASDANKAQQATTKLIEQDKVVALVGGTSSPESLAMMIEAEKANIPFMSMAASDGISKPVNPWVFQTPPPNRLIVERVIRHLVDDLKVKDFAVIYDSNAFGQSGYDGLKAEAPKAGLKIVAAQSYETNATDLTAQMNKIKAAHPAVVVSWGTNPGPAMAVKTMRELGMKQKFVGSHGIANMAFVDLAGEGKSAADNPANGTVFPAGPILVLDQADVTPEQKQVIGDFAKDYEAKTGKKANTFAGHAYDALGMLADALRKAGGDDSAKIRDAIEQTTGFVGIQGVFTYTPQNHSGLTVKDVTLIEIKNSKWVPYEAPSS